MKSKDQAARELATSHSRLEPSVQRIVRLVSETEDAPDEPIKLLELNAQTVSSGIVPVFFGPSRDVPYSSVIVEVTESEYQQVEAQKLKLPSGWHPADVLFTKT